MAGVLKFGEKELIMLSGTSEKKDLEEVISEKIVCLKHLAASLTETDHPTTLRTLWYIEQESAVLREIIAKNFIETTSENQKNQTRR